MCTGGIFFREGQGNTVEPLLPSGDYRFEKRVTDYLEFMAGQSSRPASRRFHPVPNYFLSALHEFRDMYRADPEAARGWFREFLKRVPKGCPFCEWCPGLGCPVPGYRLIGGPVQ
jgi:hypothetical protein